MAQLDRDIYMISNGSSIVDYEYPASAIMTKPWTSKKIMHVKTGFSAVKLESW
jgi:hypothetical protein